MNKKILALIVVLIAIVGFYGLVYGAVTTVLMPIDSEGFKSELSTIQTPVNDNSNITELEGAAATIEGASLKYIPQSQRTQIANGMRNNALPSEIFNPDLSEYNNWNSFKILAYDLILRGDISNQIKNIEGTRNEIIRLNNKTASINQKMATDFENGDTEAYAADIRNLANTLQQYNNTMEKLKTQLQDVIQLLGG